MGRKAHPIGLRLGLHRKWQSNWCFDSKNYVKFLHLNFNIEKFFKGILYYYPIKTILINYQIIKLPSNQIFILIFFYRLRKKKLKNMKVSNRGIKNWKYHLYNYFKDKPYNFFLNKPNINLKYETSIIKNFYLNKISLNRILSFQNYINNIILKNCLLNIKLIVINLKKIFYILKKYLNSYNLNSLIKKNIFKLKYYINYYKYFYIINKKKKYSFLKNLYLNNYLYNTTSFKNIIKNYNTLLYSKKNHTIKNNSKIQFLKSRKRIFLINKLLKIKKNWLLKKNKKNILFKNKINIKNNILKESKKFLSKLTNSKVNIIYINTLSLCKFYYYTQKKKKNKETTQEKFNLLKIQKTMFNKYKYNAIFIKDFIHLAFISTLLKNPSILVKFIAHQFKHLPKNRKQLRLLTFITQSIKIICQQRSEIYGFKLQIIGRLNRRNRSHTWTFKKGNLPIQTNSTRVEYGYTEGFTRRGLIGIRLWFFYKKSFKKIFKTNMLQYLFYSSYKKNILSEKNFKKVKNIIDRKNNPKKDNDLSPRSQKLLNKILKGRLSNKSNNKPFTKINYLNKKKQNVKTQSKKI